MDKRPIFRTDEAVPKLEYIGSGTETTASLTKLLSSKTSNSPGCAKCDNAVVFHLIRAMSAETGFRIQYAAQICLYELPVRDDKEEIAGWAFSLSRLAFCRISLPTCEASTRRRDTL
jgi:hypothetical protein